MSTTPAHPEASPDRPGAVTVSRIVARNSHHPEPYTGTRTVLVRSSKPRGPAAAGGGRTSPRTPQRRTGPQGTRNGPENFGPAAGGFTQAPGGRMGPKLESVEFPAGCPARACRTPVSRSSPRSPRRPSTTSSTDNPRMKGASRCYVLSVPRMRAWTRS